RSGAPHGVCGTGCEQRHASRGSSQRPSARQRAPAVLTKLPRTSKRTSSDRDTFNKDVACVVEPVWRRELMVELRFRVRNTVFAAPQTARRSTIRPLALLCTSVEEAALLGEVDNAGRLIPRKGVFFMSSQRTGPVIEGFEDCALGEFIKAQLEALSQNGEPPARCELHGLDPFLELSEPDDAERLRDLISVCEFRVNEFTPESAVRFLKESGFFYEKIIVGVHKRRGL